MASPGASHNITLDRQIGAGRECDTPDLGGRKCGGAEQDTETTTQTDEPGTTRAQKHEKDERDLWRDRRSASGSRPMTTR